MTEPAAAWQPSYLKPPELQDLCWDVREQIKTLHRALNKERDYREAKRPFDSHEVVIAVEDCIRALVGKAAEMREMMKQEMRHGT